MRQDANEEGGIGGAHNEQDLGGANEQNGVHNVEGIDDELALIESTLAAAKSFFIDLDLSLDDVLGWQPSRVGGRESLFARSRTDYIKAVVKKHVQDRLNAMDPEVQENMLKRENAKQFCLEIGMNPEVVEIKFAAHKRFEEELQELEFKIKVPILDAIFHLINHLDYGNPFGNNKNGTIQEYNDGDKKEPSLYMGMKVVPAGLLQAVKFIETALQERGLASKFMHGTTAASLESFQDSGVNTNHGSSILGDDFGPGFYCFKSHLNAALSYAFGRSWPDLGGSTKRVSILKDNPSVIVFPNAMAPPKDKTFHVGATPYPYSDEDLKRMLQESYKPFVAKKKGWNKDKSDTDKVMEWKHFVKLARWKKKYPNYVGLFHGWLHDSDFLLETNNCAEPKIDKDLWEQYCFKDENLLGEEHLFIELHLDWAQWVGTDCTQEELMELKTTTLAVLAKPNE